MNNEIVVTSEVRVDLAGWEGRASRRGQVIWVNRAYAKYHGIINNIRGRRIRELMSNNRLLHKSVRIQIKHLLLLSAPPHLYRPPEELALDQRGIHGSI